MLDDFTKYIEENHLFGKNDRILLAVSGGIDSMVMAHLFLAAGYKTGIAHCNFCLRPQESDKDEDLVRVFASENKIPFYSIRFKTRAYAREHGISTQMAARELRYEWFEKIRTEMGFDFVSVAHNLNDNIETLLINLIRGTGIAGLTGMRPVSNRIVRPLLFATRIRIADYRDLQKVRFREDKSNSETTYTRNKIRHLVVPVLKEINPSVEETLNETAGRLAGINEFVSSHIGSLRDRVSTVKDADTIFRINELRGFLQNSTVLFELFRPYGITGSLIKDLIKVLNGKTGGQIYTHSHRLLKNREELIIVPLQKMPRDYEIKINKITDFLDIPCIVSVEIVEVDPGFKIPDDPCVAFLDLDKVIFPMLIRSWQTGDYFFPLGMEKKKKLSDYFIDLKYPLTRKENTLILESVGNIVWIIGERIDNRFRITGSTTRSLRIEAVAR